MINIYNKYLLIKKKKDWGDWINGSAVRTLAYSSRGTGMNFWHPHDGSQLSVVPVVGDLMPSSGAHGHWGHTYIKAKYSCKHEVLFQFKTLKIVEPVWLWCSDRFLSWWTWWWTWKFRSQGSAQGFECCGWQGQPGLLDFALHRVGIPCPRFNRIQGTIHITWTLTECDKEAPLRSGSRLPLSLRWFVIDLNLPW